MFFKKEILAIENEPQCEVPDGYNYYIYARIYQLPKSGVCLIADYYRNGSVQYRYCISKNDFIMYYAQRGCGTWEKSTPYTQLLYHNRESLDKGTDMSARKLFGKDKGRAGELIDSFCTRANEKRYTQAAENRMNKQERLIAMFPPLPNDVEEWCDDNVFVNHMWLSNAHKGERTATCEACGDTFILPTNAVRHKDHTYCEKCGRESIWFLERYKNSICDKGKIHTVYKVDEYILYRWTRVMRQYTDRREYDFEDYWYSGTNTKDNKKFAYGEVKAIYSSNYIGRKKWLTPSYVNDAVLYFHGLNDIFADKLNGFDLEAEIRQGFKMDMPKLLIALYKFPQTEYLFKMGLQQFIEDIEWLNTDKNGFGGMFGISKQYYPLYRDRRVGLREHQVIKLIAPHEFVNSQLIDIIRFRKIDSHTLKNIKELFPSNASYGKILRYIDKQCYTGGGFYTIYRDYLSMAKELKIQLTKKYDIYPQNLRQEHDRLAEKVNAIRDKKSTAAFKRATSKLYKTIPTEFTDGKLMIVLPKKSLDFKTEGAELKICVGSGSYEQRHKEGKRLICFVRNTAEPDKSFVCAEIDIEKDYRVVQVHGYKNDIDKPLPKGVKTFVNKYAQEIKRFREQLNKEQKERKTA